MKSWIDKTVTLNDTWGPGAQHSLTNPLGCLPEFSLRARYLRDNHGKRHPAHLTLEFSSGFLADGWHNITFTPMGSKAVSDIGGLPAWDASHRDTYRKLINSAKSLDNSQTERLEAVIPYLDKGHVAYNTVRLFYVTNAVKGPIVDLVVVRISHHTGIPGTVQARQEGGAQGPPH
ncbi:MAG TPA: hypothetical protein VK695_01625 [Steroidobacteraceae bacterium]|nr:hypothetical protein [Steroidobacteraceae bacterium]